MPGTRWIARAGLALGMGVAASRGFAGEADAFRCTTAEVAGLPAADAATAVALVCRELSAASGGSGAYVVSLRALGRSVVVTARHEGGTDDRSLVLAGLEEVPVAAPRLARAVALGTPVDETQRVDNLVEHEGRRLVTRSGSRKFELGALALGAGQGTGMGAGFALGLAYDSPAFAIPAELRFAHSSDGNRDLSVFSIDTGVRHFFSGRSTSAFVGGGVSMLYLSLSEWREGELYVTVEDSHWGPGLYAEGGVQLFRLHRGRMTAKVRADFPLYSLHPQGDAWEPSGRYTRPIHVDEGTRYVVPVTFGLTMSF